MRYRLYALALLSLLLLHTCSNNKDNPLEARNRKPTIDVIGFSSQTLTFQPDKDYLFEFKASDPDSRGNLQITLSVSPDSAGAVQLLPGSEAGIYQGRYRPNYKGAHKILIVVSDGLLQETESVSVTFVDNLLPTAVIAYDQLRRVVTDSDTAFSYRFDAGGSSDVDGEIKTAIWRFDGVALQAAPEEKVEHTFEHFGRYRVSLTVLDDLGGVDSTAMEIDNALLRLRIDADKLSGEFPLSVRFSAEADNGSRAEITYEWDFGDGTPTSSDRNPVHVFQADGDYTVSCTAGDPVGSVRATLRIRSNDGLPVAKVRIATGGPVVNGQAITLDGSESFDSNGAIEQFSWLLQPPGRETELLAVLGEPRFDYQVRAAVGANRVGLVVQDATGNASDTAWVALQVANQQPVADFEVQVLPFLIEVVTNNSNDPDPFDVLQQQWFVDGSEYSGQRDMSQPRFSFEDEGLHSIRLRVTDGNGGADESEKSIFVIGGPQARLTGPVQTSNTTSVLLDGSGSSGSGGTALSRYEFYRLDAGEVLLQSAASTTCRFEQILPVGAHEFGLRVTDVNNVTSALARLAVIWLSTPPTSEFEYIVNLEEVQITANTSSDIDPGDVLSYTWWLDGRQVSTAATPVIPASGGLHQLRLVSQDQHGESASKQIDVSVPGRPQARFVFPNNLETFETRNQQDVVLDAGFSDGGHDGGGILVYEWLLKYRDGTALNLGVADAPEFTFRTHYPVGDYEIGLQVTNGNRVQSDVTYNSMTILNSAPLVAFAAEPGLSKISVVSNESRDIDPGDAIVSYEWFLAEAFVSVLQYPVLQTRVQGGNFDLLLRVKDSFNASASKVLNLDVPGKPVADFVFPGGQDDYVVKNDISFILDASSSDGGHLQGGIDSFTWFLKRPDASQETLSSSSKSEFEFTARYKPGEYEIGLQIRNNANMVSTTAWKKLEIANSAPNAGFRAVKISCSSTVQTIEVTANSSKDIDPGDKIVDYVWLIDGVEQASRRGLATPAISTRADAEVVELLAIDSYGAQGQVSVQIAEIACKYVCGGGNCAP